MEYSIDELELLDLRKRRLLGRIREISGSMTGETASVRDLFCSEDGSFDPKRARMLCDRLVDCIDIVQKHTWLVIGDAEMGGIWASLGGYTGEDTPQMSRIVEWYTRLRGIDGSADDAEKDLDIHALDLRTLPTTFTPKQQRLVKAFVWCVLYAVSYFYYDRRQPSIEEMRALAHKTSQQIGAARYLEHGNHILTREGLMESELVQEGYFGLASGQNNFRFANIIDEYDENYYFGDINLFEMMDCLYVTLTDSSATTLDPEEVTRAFKDSERGATVYEQRRKEKELYEAVHLAVLAKRSMQPLTGLDDEEWKRLNLICEAPRAVLAALPTCSAAAFAMLPHLLRNDDSVAMEYLFDKDGTPWRNMTRESRENALRSALSFAVNRIEEYDDEDNKIDYVHWLAESALEGEDGYRSFDRDWAKMIGGTDDLFEQYRVLRSCLRGKRALGQFNDEELELPSGYIGTWNDYHDVPGSFEELFDKALDMLLAELGISHYADDQAYHRTYAYLGETRYQMNRLIEGE